MSVHDFGNCTKELLQGSSDEQYQLSTSHESLFSFTTTVQGQQYNTSFIFRPFNHDSCAYTYHTYHLRAQAPLDVSAQALKESGCEIIELAQLLYDRHLKHNAGYHFRFLEAE